MKAPLSFLLKRSRARGRGNDENPTGSCYSVAVETATGCESLGRAAGSPALGERFGPDRCSASSGPGIWGNASVRVRCAIRSAGRNLGTCCRSRVLLRNRWSQRKPGADPAVVSYFVRHDAVGPFARAATKPTRLLGGVQCSHNAAPAHRNGPPKRAVSGVLQGGEICVLSVGGSRYSGAERTTE